MREAITTHTVMTHETTLARCQHCIQRMSLRSGLGLLMPSAAHASCRIGIKSHELVDGPGPTKRTNSGDEKRLNGFSGEAHERGTANDAESHAANAVLLPIGIVLAPGTSRRVPAALTLFRNTTPSSTQLLPPQG
jgi:hypothetical protein